MLAHRRRVNADTKTSKWAEFLPLGGLSTCLIYLHPHAKNKCTAFFLLVLFCLSRRRRQFSFSSLNTMAYVQHYKEVPRPRVIFKHLAHPKITEGTEGLACIKCCWTGVSAKPDMHMHISKKIILEFSLQLITCHFLCTLKITWSRLKPKEWILFYMSNVLYGAFE